MESYSKKGYLYDNFKIFHLIDTNLGEIDFHYHDFHKVLIHLSGNTSYSIEGQTFDLEADDIVFVNAGEVHRPIFHDDSLMSVSSFIFPRIFWLSIVKLTMIYPIALEMP